MNAYLMAKAKESYQMSAVNTASPVRLIVMLYDGGIKFLKMAELLYEEREAEKARRMIVRVEKIILELMASLNFEQGGEIALNLLELYQFMLKECAEVDEENHREKINGLLKLFSGLREAWMEVEKKLPR
ncbi:flagellar export chaperone FliS [Atrimonas thermophila]|jgi:flagellar protein FliS|uniref:flagellar export chaperone FliS n=1 Tax=Atrimonas thermophila TaxID=3064161 RepID=UPI00399C592C